MQSPHLSESCCPISATSFGGGGGELACIVRQIRVRLLEVGIFGDFRLEEITSVALNGSPSQQLVFESRP